MLTFTFEVDFFRFAWFDFSRFAWFDFSRFAWFDFSSAVCPGGGETTAVGFGFGARVTVSGFGLFWLSLRRDTVAEVDVFSMGDALALSK